jgi:hypothetical protein
MVPSRSAYSSRRLTVAQFLRGGHCYLGGREGAGFFTYARDYLESARRRVRWWVRLVETLAHRGTIQARRWAPPAGSLADRVSRQRARASHEELCVLTRWRRLLGNVILRTGIIIPQRHARGSLMEARVRAEWRRESEAHEQAASRWEKLASDVAAKTRAARFGAERARASRAPEAGACICMHSTRASPSPCEVDTMA